MAAFKRIDTKKTGKISLESLWAILCEFGEPLSDKEFEELVKHGDPRSEGQIDILEFSNKMFTYRFRIFWRI